MTLEHLATDDSVTVGDAIEIALSTQVYGVGAWQARLNEAWQRLDIDINADVDATHSSAVTRTSAASGTPARTAGQARTP